jgi:hypothetical protein
MDVIQSNDGKNKGTYFICKNKNCRQQISIRKNTFFERSHVSIADVMRLILYLV